MSEVDALSYLRHCLNSGLVRKDILGNVHQHCQLLNMHESFIEAVSALGGEVMWSKFYQYSKGRLGGYNSAAKLPEGIVNEL